MKRSGTLRRGLWRRKPPKPRPPEGPLRPAVWVLEAYRLAQWRSELSGTKVTRGIGEVHHPLPKRWLRANGYHQLVWHPDNSMVLTKHEHEQHENGSRRVRFAELPDRAVAFAASLGQPALVAVERHHPKEEPHAG